MLTETPKTTQQLQRREQTRTQIYCRCSKVHQKQRNRERKANERERQQQRLEERKRLQQQNSRREDGKQQQQHGWKPDKYENRKQRCHVHCIAKEHEIHELNQQSVKYRTANGMQNRSQRNRDQVTQKYGRQAKVTSSSALENRRINTVLQSF